MPVQVVLDTDAGPPRRRRAARARKRSTPRGPHESPNWQKKCIDTIRFLAVDAVEKANSGHPGMPMGAARWPTCSGAGTCASTPRSRAGPTATASCSRAGHGSMLLYACSTSRATTSAGRAQALPPVRLEDAGPPGVPRHAGRRGHHRSARPGHRQRGGHGARRRRMLAARFNRPSTTIIDHFIYGICSRRRSDGGRGQRGLLARRATSSSAT